MTPSRDKILREAEKLVQRGKVEQAIREYEKLLKKNPNDANTINRVGDLYGRVGQIDKAVELYERIAEHFTQDGFTTKAIAILKKINRLAPQRLDIFDRLADLYMQQGLMVEAKSQYQILADWYIKNDDHDKAVNTHRKLVQIDPNNHMAHLRLADLLMHKGNAAEAMEVYQRLGQVLLERDKLDEAERLYRHALDQDPPDGEFMVPICEALLDSGRTATAREFLNAAVQRSPDSDILRRIEARAHLAFGESEDALTKAKEALEANPEDHEARALVAKAMLSSGDVDEARELLLPACEQLLERGEFGAVQQLVQDLLDALPDDELVLKLAIRAHRPSGDEKKLSGLTASLANTLYRDGTLDQADQLYAELLQGDPRNQSFRQRLAEIRGVDPAEIEVVPVEEERAVFEQEPVPAPVSGEASATSAIGDAEAVEPFGAADRDFDPEERLAEAKVFAKYGLIEKAVSHLEAIIRECPDEVEARGILVSLYVEQGDKDAALPVANSLLEHYRAIDDQVAAEALLLALPELAPEAEEESEAEVTEEDEVIVLDLDEALKVAAEEELFAAATQLEADGTEAELVEVVEETEIVDQPSGSEALDDELVIDLDAADAYAEEELLTPTAEAAGTAEPVAEATPAEAEMIEGDEAAEELGEAVATGAGPTAAVLAQLDSFIESDLHEDAIRLLGKLESEFPGDANVAERRLGLKAKGVLLEEVVAVSEKPEELFADEEESYVDLAAELELEMAEEEAMVDEATGRGKEEALLEEVFKEFQKGVEEQLSEADSDTHFNLGIAYKEMGLLPEAIREFQVSSRDPNMLVESCSMIGVCYMEQGMWGQAAEWYQKALGTPNLTQEAQLALRYDLASALESAGENDRAMELFESIVAADPSYRDVGLRLNRLAAQRQVN